jgi:hypothetical protein
MIFSEAKKEFQVRYYLWAISEWEKEIEDLFPNLRSFKAGTVWETHQFMQQLPKGDQLILAGSLLKRFHSDAVKTLGESMSPEEQSLRDRRDNFFRIRGLSQAVQRLRNDGQSDLAGELFKLFRADALQIVEKLCFDDETLLAQLDVIYKKVPQSFEDQIGARKMAGEKIKFSSKRKLQKAMEKKFQDVFGGQYFDFTYDDIGDLASWFRMKCGSWIISTNFWYGRGQGLIEYSHTISSGHDVEQQGSKGTYWGPLVLSTCISFTARLGITSQTQWEYLSGEEIEPTCDNVISHCRHFFEVAPKLLKGLEFEKITMK